MEGSNDDDRDAESRMKAAIQEYLDNYNTSDPPVDEYIPELAEKHDVDPASLRREAEKITLSGGDP